MRNADWKNHSKAFYPAIRNPHSSIEQVLPGQTIIICGCGVQRKIGMDGKEDWLKQRNKDGV
jgi:hypothetical protein